MASRSFLKRQSGFSLIATTVLLATGCSTQNYQEILDAQKIKPLTSFSQEITCPDSNLTFGTGAAKSLRVTVKNTGPELWHLGQKAMEVELGYRWRDDKGAILPIEGNRAPVTEKQLSPGQSVSSELTVVAPKTPGSYTLLVTMVQEQVAWFTDKGATPFVLKAKVEGTT